MRCSRRLLTTVLASGLLMACDETDECRDLEVLVADYEREAARLRAQADLHDKANERVDVAKAEANKLLKKLGLDKTEDEIHEVLEDRARAMGVVIERGTREIALGSGSSDGATEKQVVWNFKLSAKDEAEAVEQSRKLAGSPPLLRYVALLGGKEKGEGWLFRLGVAQVDKLDFSQIKPAAAPELRAPDTIASEFGFCGASKLRSKISDLQAEMKALKPTADKMTVAMPKAASWEGVRRRTLQMQAEEGEARAILDDLLTAAVRANVSVKAAGVEGAVVILELRGGPKQRKAFLSKLPPKALESLKPAGTERPGLIRYMRMIPAADVRRRQGSPEQHMQPGHAH